MPFNVADIVTIKGDVSLSQVQIYPGFHQYGQSWQFAMVRIIVYKSFICYLNLFVSL